MTKDAQTHRSSSDVEAAAALRRMPTISLPGVVVTSNCMSTAAPAAVSEILVTAQFPA